MDTKPSRVRSDQISSLLSLNFTSSLWCCLAHTLVPLFPVSVLMVGWSALLSALLICCVAFWHVVPASYVLNLFFCDFLFVLRIPSSHRMHSCKTRFGCRASSTLAPNPVVGNITAFAEFVASPAAQAASVASFIDSARGTLTQEDFQAVPFDLQNAEDAKVFEALTRNKAAFQSWRENTARTVYHMELNDYEALFAKSRSSLLDLAESVQVPVVLHSTSYASLMKSIDAAVTAGERASPKGTASFVEARVSLAALRESAYLYEGRTTLHSLIVQDAITYGVGSQIAEAFDWVVMKVRTYKCAWCKSIVTFIRRAACVAAGDAICVLMTTAMGGPVGLIASKFFCGFPLYLGRLFATWCTQGVQWLQKQTRVTDECLCAFTVPQMLIPATTFTVLKMTVFSSPQRAVTLGQICVTQAGQCVGSTQTEQDKYDANKKIEDEKREKAAAEEAERVKKMTLQQKIAYHQKILAGQIKTNMSEKLVFDLLQSVTGLGKSAGQALLRGATELAKGNIKGAAMAAGGQLISDVAKMGAKQVAKQVAGKVVQLATASAVDATTRVAVNKVAGIAARGVAAGAATMGNAASNSVAIAGKAATNLSATVAGAIGGAKAEASVRKTGEELTATVSSVTGKVVEGSAGFVGKVMVDAGRNAAAHSARNAVANTLGERAGSAVSGGTVSKIPTQYVIPKAEQEARAARFRVEHEAQLNATRKAQEAAKNLARLDN